MSYQINYINQSIHQWHIHKILWLKFDNEIKKLKVINE